MLVGSQAEAIRPISISKGLKSNPSGGQDHSLAQKSLRIFTLPRHGIENIGINEMVLHKWALVSRGAPPPAGLMPRIKDIPRHPRLIPSDYKTPYILRTFIKDRHVSDIQHIENRGMYKEELTIERSRFPRMNKTLVVNTDGSLNEREFEFCVPPVMVVFQDRRMAHRQRLQSLAKIGRLSKPRSWEATLPEGESQQADQQYCNALCFPYCVPKSIAPRPSIADPLTAKRSHDEDASSE